ncbi:hypothetical protein [uncultured Chitinophaga sp.]|uniref:hypothetical protein n=1 Tax=uncultured Chitinophaga sp. TaxID=339340 RepID=UPI0025DFA28D|nr:hypothetical protein [uncultured Chitinophaga sp.]
MMQKTLMSAALLLALFSSCQQAGKPSEKDSVTTTAAPVDSVDLLSKEVMDIHDEGMAKMMTIRRLKAQLDTAIMVQKKAGKPVTVFTEQQASLEVANSAMNNWMHVYDMDLEGKDAAQKKAYLLSERTKITAVRDTMLNAIDAATKVLQNK